MYLSNSTRLSSAKHSKKLNCITAALLCVSASSFAGKEVEDSKLHAALATQHTHKHAGEICGTDHNSQNWSAIQKENAQQAKLSTSFSSQILTTLAAQDDFAAQNGNGVAGRYYIPVVVHIYGDRYNCDTGTYCLTEQKVIDGLNKSNQDFLGLITDDGPIAPEFQAIRQNLNIEFVLAKTDPKGQPTTGIIRYPEKAGYGKGSGVDEQIAADAWDNFKYMNIYVQQDLYDDGKTNNSGVAWYPQLSMSQNGLSRVVYNGDYIGANTNENFRSVLTHEFGHWLNLPHTFDGGCTIHSEPFCNATGDGTCDTPQMSSSILQDNAKNCLGQATNTENFMHYSDNYAMFTKDQVDRMTAALHGPARATLWSNANLIATGLGEYTSNADHPWDGSSGAVVPPKGEVLQSFTNLSGEKGKIDNFEIQVPEGTQAVAFYLDGYDEDPDMYVSKGKTPIKTGDNWEADFISFRSAGSPELVTLSAPSSVENYHTAIDAYSAYSNATLSIIAGTDNTLCSGCERIFLAEIKDLKSAKGAEPKAYQFEIPADAVRTIAVMNGGYQGDPDLYASMNAVPTKEIFDCGPFSAPRLSEYCELSAGGGTLNLLIDPFLEYSDASLVVYYERAANSDFPVAQANGPYSGLLDNPISFSSAGSFDANGNITTYLWEFGDGNTSTEANPTHAYHSANTFSVKLTVTDNDGNTASDIATAVVRAQNLAPIAVANGPYTGEAGKDIQFSSANSSDPDGNIASYLWQFGDGQSSTEANPAHSYTEAGDYTATLTVTDNDGLNHSAQASVSVNSISYCEATGNTRYEWIAKVQSGAFSNASQANGYSDFTSQVIELTEGDNQFILTPGGNYTEHWAAWIDFNENGQFEQSEQVLNNLSGKGTVTGIATIPSGNVGKSVRMRIAMKYNDEATSACGNIGDGEVEDYTVTIKSNDAIQPLPNACAAQSPISGGRLEAGKATCLGGDGALWLSIGGVDSARNIAITTAHGQSNLHILYKNGGWPSDNDKDAESNSGTMSECITIPAGNQYWSYLKVSGDTKDTSIIVDFNSEQCRQP
ncbi:M43 family zinc metalloprotease [Pseudoalteromonas luteoviolacea]|uniref:Collagenase n=1 Tax=Pseudoalteromonas luteoviolacea S4054 TaxID=1129367 RepID=A0A0F6A6B2_9GAMM|nr:M43 family zinc metalloprotease [Pseudoalteromonas luteoviolacea]AOT08144.1 collagenase [Pseudoalteromonas luteoviolacea]AOT13061.1 collagenase [Pseudoalteromonas luteoviolacea]AOT17973.1 collagenase [Pseudoalteromonas luteoviolacea]KKE81658.1 collagenase [Pseudoalteromonas luteoviolacea S4054]KZN69491.1 collagenase [Pseudoalteromonas luteoviolacea S4047-1]